MDWLRAAGPLALALVSAVAIDQLTEARQLQPPGFRSPWRRVGGLMVVALVLYPGVFLSLAQIGAPLQIDFDAVATHELFLLHGMLLAALAAWLVLGFAGEVAMTSFPGVVLRQLGLRLRGVLRELVIGLGTGLLIWPVLLLAVLLVVGLLFLLGGETLLPAEPPAMIVWIAAMPIGVRLLIALSAGVVEEVFFRGFLQPRVGVALSTLLFVLAHLAYDQPFMLVGITLLSLYFATLTLWRQSVWAAIAAHFLFDAVQLLLVIPWALEQWHSGGSRELAPLVGMG
ncbi:MAG TPA: CPBP family intramembrane glutamic endopeptidase [Thermoanaerobaculia bacterium]|nr:CPBP family intramembrane glutamic endopeptidase [Thermoanaerobaculia bacterium]